MISPLPVTAMAMGYRATETEQSLTIHDVEIFCTCKRWGIDFDEVWIKKAVEHAMAQQRGGYMPPLHAMHHGNGLDDSDVKAAGWFKITKAAPFTFQGQRRTAIYADLIITDPDIREDMKATRYPYRSVEMFEAKKPVIDGLALLDHEAPFLELPMLMLAQLEGQEQERFATADTFIPGGTLGSMAARAGMPGSWRMDRTEDDGPVVACFQRGDSMLLLFRQEADMTKTEEKTEVEPKPTQQTFASDDNGEKKKDKDESENMEEGDVGLDVSGVVKAIESGAISIADMDLILAAIQSQGAEPEEEEKPQEAPAPAMAPGSAAMKKEQTANSVQMAALSGKLEAMEAINRERDAKELREKDVAGALKRLEGRALGADPETRWLKIHEAHGSQAFQAHIDEMAETFGVLPSGTDPVQFTANDPKAPDCVQKFYKQGPDEGEKAAKFAANWQKLRDHGLHLGSTQERYVETNMELAQA